MMGPEDPTDPSELHRRWKSFGIIAILARTAVVLSAVAAALTLMISTYFAVTPVKTGYPMLTVLTMGELNPIPVAILCGLMVLSLSLQRFAEKRRATFAAKYEEITGEKPSIDL